jgi:hypothetical protein
MADDITDIEERFERLSLDAKLRLIERLVRRVRLGDTFGAAAFEQSVKEMASDPDMLREMGVTND